MNKCFKQVIRLRILGKPIDLTKNEFRNNYS